MTPKASKNGQFSTLMGEVEGEVKGREYESRAYVDDY